MKENQIRDGLHAIEESIDALKTVMLFDSDPAGPPRLQELLEQRDELRTELLRSAVGIVN
jgi:hypothetical protein